MGNFLSDDSENEELRLDKAVKSLHQQVFYARLLPFSQTIEGNVYTPEEGEKYMQARKNDEMPDERGYPIVIAQPYTTADVIKIVNFYRSYCCHIELCIGSAKHATKCMNNDAFVIDLQHMSEITVNIQDKLVTVGGGASVGDTNHVLSSYNLAIPMGIHPETGIAGVTLGGGYGLLTRKYGMTVDHLHEIHIVLSTGQEVIATRHNEYYDLLWACCGGGGNYGIVTQFIFEANDILSKSLAGSVVYYTPTLVSATTLLAKADLLIQKMSIDDCAVFTITSKTTTIGTSWIHYGKETSINDVPILQEARHLGGWYRMEDSVHEREYHHDITSMFSHNHQHHHGIKQGCHVYTAVIPVGSYDTLLPPDFFESLIRYVRGSLHAFLSTGKVLLITMGGDAINYDIDSSHTCIATSARKARYFVVVECWWRAEYDRHGKIEAKDWTHGIFDLCSPYKSSSLGLKSSHEVLSSISEQSEFKENDGMIDFRHSHLQVYQRLQHLKQKYDPRNMFINTINIEPYEKIEFTQRHVIGSSL